MHRKHETNCECPPTQREARRLLHGPLHSWTQKLLERIPGWDRLMPLFPVLFCGSDGCCLGPTLLALGLLRLRDWVARRLSRAAEIQNPLEAAR